MENKLDDTNYTKKMQSDNVQGFLPDQTGNCQHIKKKKPAKDHEQRQKKKKKEKSYCLWAQKLLHCLVNMS